MNNIIYEDAKKIAQCNLEWGKFNHKTILITGANGYVPSYFVYSFMQKNKEENFDVRVIALCRNEKKAIEKFGEYIEDQHFRLVIQDVCMALEIDEKVDYIIHAASPAGIWSRHQEPLDTFNANLLGCYNLLEIAQKNDIEGFLFLSSVDAYGKMDNDKRLEETDLGVVDSLNVRNAYTNGKRAAESLCVCAYHQKNIPVKIVRPFQIIGPQIELNDGRLHADFVNQIKNEGKIVLKSDGTAKRSFMYITDAIEAMLWVLLYGKTGELYNVVDEAGEATVYELAKKFIEAADKTEKDVVFDLSKRETVEVKQAYSCVIGSSEKLRQLGWEPTISLSEAVRRMLAFYMGRDD